MYVLSQLHQFLPVDKTFKEIVHYMSSDPRILSFVQCNKSCDLFHGSSLNQVIINGLSTMEGISNQLMNNRETFCGTFPRLWLLSDREVIQLLSSPTLPFVLQPFICKCFRGVRWLEVDGELLSHAKDVDSCETVHQGHRGIKVLGIFGSLHEHITFVSPLEQEDSASEWLFAFEKQLKTTMAQLMMECSASLTQFELSSQDLVGDKVADRRTLLLDLLQEYPLQCLLVAEEASWCDIVRQAFHESSPVSLRNIAAYSSEKLKSLCHILRECKVSKYTMMCVYALVQLIMKQAQQLSELMKANCTPLESSFEWVRLLKYHINSKDWCPKSQDTAACHVDVLNRCLKYDDEYYGPEDLVMVQTPSTDRAILGILLALTSHRCGFLRGPSMSGKKNTAVHLGKALGRHVHIFYCSPNMTSSVVQRTLLGALQAGVWFVMDSVDLLSSGVQSSLGEDLAEIYRYFSGSKRSNGKAPKNEPDEKSGDQARCPDSALHVILGGKSIYAHPTFACVAIASNWCSSEVPESLRTASRAVALSPPDYRIIAEVMLTSFGFSDGMSLSQRLVSLLSLTKSSLCLPEFITDSQSSHLVLLQKIIRASVSYLQQSLRHCHSSGEDAEKSLKYSRVCASVTQLAVEETAVARGILSVCLPLLYEQKKSSQFKVIFKETFPTVCQFPPFQQHIVDKEKKQLTDALSAELQSKLLHFDPELIRSVVTLDQTLKSHKAVMLLGPSGSGKTMCYSVLAASLNHLALTGGQSSSDHMNDSVIHGHSPQMSVSSWAFVDTVVLFPNTMTHEEMFGCFCEKGGWQDGAIAKVLRDSDQPNVTNTTDKKNSNQTPVTKWLVLDGNPVGQPGWLDYLTTLYSSEDPSLCLPSGEILPSHSHLKLIMEVTDLSDASPSAIAHCSLVYLPGVDQWKSVWKSEMNALSLEHKLEQGTLQMWNHLVEDLFSSTLRLVRENNLTSAIHNERESSKHLSYGLQEVMSFVRILRSLLQHLGKAVVMAKIERGIKNDFSHLIFVKTLVFTASFLTADEHRNDAASKSSHVEHELHARSSFLCAYIWGFGGHLHPR